MPPSPKRNHSHLSCRLPHPLLGDAEKGGGGWGTGTLGAGGGNDSVSAGGGRVVLSWRRLFPQMQLRVIMSARR